MNPKNIIIMSLMIALEVILSRFVSVQTLTLRISFGFLPIAITGMLFGPVYAGLAAAIGDIIGFALVPTGPFFPGFTLTAFLTGAVYGLLLHKPAAGLFKVSLAAFLVCIPLHLCLDTIWLRILTGRGFLVLLPPRVLKSLVMIPIQILLIYTVRTQVLARLLKGENI